MEVGRQCEFESGISIIKRIQMEMILSAKLNVLF